MLLVIDVGNTNIVVGVYQGENLLHAWRLRTERDATEDEFHVMLRSLFASEGTTLEAIDGVAISCVVPPMTKNLHSFCVKHLRRAPVWIDGSHYKGMPILYDNPGEVGADRIVNAVAAFQKYKTALVVVDFGTATTFDCISTEGAYLGGAISPGLLISSEALFQNASKLPRVEIFVQPERVIAKNTIASMNAGILFGYASLVDGMVERIKKEMSPTPKVVATGGLAQLMSSVAQSLECVEPHLSLEGLRIIYENTMNAR
jgi:type III pantothenate kinase